jgi:hypothetical protein
LLGSFLGSSVLRRLERVERVLRENAPDRVFDVVLLDPVQGGIFGHSHTVYRLTDRNTNTFACSDEEEIELMKEKYEDFGHRFFAQGEVLSFPDFLEHFFYLSPNVPEERKKAAVQKLREAANSLSNPSTNYQNKSTS